MRRRAKTMPAVPPSRAFLTLLGDALAEQRGPDAAVERDSGDGQFRIHLQPLEPGTQAHIHTPQGTFAGRDHLITITATH